jgi:hypothetical protein
VVLTRPGRRPCWGPQDRGGVGEEGNQRRRRGPGVSGSLLRLRLSGRRGAVCFCFPPTASRRDYFGDGDAGGGGTLPGGGTSSATCLSLLPSRLSLSCLSVPLISGVVWIKADALARSPEKIEASSCSCRTWVTRAPAVRGAGAGAGGRRTCYCAKGSFFLCSPTTSSWLLPWGRCVCVRFRRAIMSPRLMQN